MYINPIAKQTAETKAAHKRKKGGGESTFAETVESLLELDAVDIASPNKQKEQRKDGFGQGREEEGEAERESSAPDSVPKKKGGERSLNIRA